MKNSLGWLFQCQVKLSYSLDLVHWEVVRGLDDDEHFQHNLQRELFISSFAAHLLSVGSKQRRDVLLGNCPGYFIISLPR